MYGVNELSISPSDKYLLNSIGAVRATVNFPSDDKLNDVAGLGKSRVAKVLSSPPFSFRRITELLRRTRILLFG